MKNISSLTQDYVNAFNSKNLEKTSELIHADAILFDPANPNGIFGKENVIKMISNLFNDIEDLNFKAKHIFCDVAKDTSIIEFELIIDKKTLKGVDVVQWENNKIIELRAYLY